MLKKNLIRLVVAGCLFVSVSVSRAESVAQNFAGNPLTNGWSVFGDASLFSWNSTNQNLRVTWDSTHPNSYFLHPLGTTITRYDDFQIEFDMQLDDFVTGTEPDKTGPLPISVGLLNFASATNAGFNRGNYGESPNVAAFDFFPYGYYTFLGDVYASAATTVGDFVSGGGFGIAPTIFRNHEIEFPSNLLVHVAMKFTAKNQALALTLATNNVVFYQSPLVLVNSTTNSSFGIADDYQVDTFCVSSFTGLNDFYNSVLAHGTVDNLSVFVPPVQDFTGALTNTVWQAQFRGRTNWSFTLERMTNFSAWSNVSATVSGTGTNIFLSDPNPPSGSAFYRVRATQP